MLVEQGDMADQMAGVKQVSTNMEMVTTDNIDNENDEADRMSNCSSVASARSHRYKSKIQ